MNKLFASSETIRLRVVSFFESAERWLVKVLFGQLFLTSFSLPLLLWWGLPLSTLSILGNIIFNPFIGLFLLLCTLLFFCELLQVPSMPFVWALEHLTDVWLWCVAQGTRHALIALPRPSGAVMLAISCIALLIMYHFVHRQKSGILVFALFLLATGVVLRFGACLQRTITVPYSSRSLLLVAHHKHCFLCDTEGILRAGAHNSSWADFTLRPELVAKLGRTACDALVIMHPTQARLRAADELARRLHIPYLVLPEDVLPSLGHVLSHVQTTVVPLERDLLHACYGQDDERAAQAIKKVWYSSKNFTKNKMKEYYARKNNQRHAA